MRSFIATMCCLVMASSALANDYDIGKFNRYDLLAPPISESAVITFVTPAPPMETRITAEVANRWSPAPASDAQYAKLQAGGAAARVVTRSRTVTRSYASAGAGYGYARAQPVRRVFGGLFRGRLGCAMGSCSY